MSDAPDMLEPVRVALSSFGLAPVAPAVKGSVSGSQSSEIVVSTESALSTEVWPGAGSIVAILSRDADASSTLSLGAGSGFFGFTVAS